MKNKKYIHTVTEFFQHQEGEPPSGSDFRHYTPRDILDTTEPGQPWQGENPNEKKASWKLVNVVVSPNGNGMLLAYWRQRVE